MSQHQPITGFDGEPQQSGIVPSCARMHRRLWPALLLALGASPLAQAATFAPVTVSDLVTAINTANSNGTDDSIDLGGRTFTLTTYLPEIQPSGSLKIHNGTLARDPNSSERFRVLGISSGSNFTLERVTLTGGSLPGNEDTFGGGLGARNSTVQIIDSTITGNSARYGGGVAQGEFNAGGGLVTITNSTISNNQAARGGGISVVDSELRIVASTIVDNAAGTGGSSGDNGAFYIQAGNVLMTRSISAGGCESYSAAPSAAAATTWPPTTPAAA